jgi:hypothetical protein
MGTAALQTLQEPILLLPSVCFRVCGSFPYPTLCRRKCPCRHHRRRWSAGMHAASGCMHGCVLLGSSFKVDVNQQGLAQQVSIEARRRASLGVLVRLM